MSVIKPKFVDSPYFVGEEDNWHLLPGAPEDVVREFEKFMEEHEEAEERGIAL